MARGRGGLIGVLCFSLGSRLRGKDGGCLNRRLRRFSQMGYDAPRPFVPGFWVPACAGMTGINREWFTLTLGPPLNLPLGGGGRWLEGEGINWGV